MAKTTKKAVKKATKPRKPKKTAAAAPKPKPSISKLPFIYMVNYETTTSYEDDGDEYSRINGVTIKSVTVSSVLNAAYKEFRLKKDNLLGRYGMSRILSVHGIFDTKNYEASWGYGYYGDEVQAVRFTGQLRDIDKALHQYLGFGTLKEKVEHLLVCEYGYLLEALKDRKWEEAKVDKELLVFGNTNHYHKLDRNVVGQYADWDLLHAVCVKDGDRYRIMDGYHRSAALLQSNHRKAHIVYAT